MVFGEAHMWQEKVNL
jgi:hypothetical protein